MFGDAVTNIRNVLQRCAMRIQLLVSLASLLAVLPSQELELYELPGSAVAAVRAVAPIEPFVLLARLGGLDLRARGDAHAVWKQLKPRTQCALVRAGLRAIDPDVAIGAAAMAGEGSWLDVAECKRAATVGKQRCNVENTPFDVADLFKLMDAADTAQFLTNPGPRPREIPQFFGALHQRFGPEHYAQVEQLCRSDEVLVRRDAARYLGVVRVDRQRYASFLLSMPDDDKLPDDFDLVQDRAPVVPRPFTLRPAGDGYAPLLAAVLERVFLGSGELDEEHAAFAWRWARDAKPGEVDRELLQRLAQSSYDAAQRVAVHGLVVLGGEGVDEVLAALAEGADGEELAPLLALGERVRRGHAAAKVQLVELAASAPLALAMLWQIDRKAAQAIVVVAFDSDAERGAQACEHLDAAVDAARFWGMPMEGLDAVLVEKAEAASLDAVRLGYLLEHFPAVRTKKLGERAIAAIISATVASMPLGVLEAVDAPALAERLRAVLADAAVGREALRAALKARLRLRGVAFDEAEVRQLWTLSERLDDEEDRAAARIRLASASVGGKAVVGLSTEALAQTKWAPSWRDAGTLAGAMAAGGLDVGLCLSLADDWQEAEPSRFAAVLDAVLEPLRANDARKALRGWLAKGPELVSAIDALWTFDDPAARAYLARARDEREHNLHRWAIGELARAGDPDARAVVEHVIKARLYGWLDTFDDDVLTDGKSLARVPLLMTQVDSNCCTYAVVATALEHVFELEAFVNELGALRRPDVVRAAWQRSEGHLRWSQIADRWLFLPQ
ncbi:MAG: hypothetical protein ABIP94_16880 [Planctomycetota bacterium]